MGRILNYSVNNDKYGIGCEILGPLEYKTRIRKLDCIDSDFPAPSVNSFVCMVSNLDLFIDSLNNTKKIQVNQGPQKLIGQVNSINNFLTLWRLILVIVFIIIILIMYKRVTLNWGLYLIEIILILEIFI